MIKLIRFVLKLIPVSFYSLASAQPSSPPTFPEQYTAHGVILLPYAELREPFAAYYDGQLNRSRIDYYGDLMITVQKSRAAVKDDDALYGTEFQIGELNFD